MVEPEKFSDEKRRKNAIAAERRFRQLSYEDLNRLISAQDKVDPMKVAVNYDSSLKKYIVKNKDSALIHAVLSITNMNMIMRYVQHSSPSKPSLSKVQSSVPSYGPIIFTIKYDDKNPHQPKY